jgi:hypothetical protein
MHQAAFERYGMSPDTHGGLERSQDQADALIDALIDALPEPLRNQVAASLAPPKTLAERVAERVAADMYGTGLTSHLIERTAEVIATADRLREPEVRERVLEIFTRHGLKGSLSATLAIEDITALLGGRHE